MQQQDEKSTIKSYFYVLCYSPAHKLEASLAGSRSGNYSLAFLWFSAPPPPNFELFWSAAAAAAGLGCLSRRVCAVKPNYVVNVFGRCRPVKTRRRLRVPYHQRPVTSAVHYDRNYSTGSHRSCVRMVTWSAAPASSCKLWDEPVAFLPWFWFHLCSSGVSSVSGTLDGKKYPGWEYICHPIFSKLCSAWGGETWTGKVPNNHPFTICYLSIGKIFSSLGWFSKLIIRNRNQIFIKPW